MRLPNNRVGNLMRGAARAMGHRLVHLSDPTPEVSDEVLRERIAFSESVRKLVKVEEFALFHADAIKRINAKKDELVSMPAVEFESAMGIELKGRIEGYQEAFARLRQITLLGDDARVKLESRMAEANAKQ